MILFRDKVWGFHTHQPNRKTFGYTRIWLCYCLWQCCVKLESWDSGRIWHQEALRVITHHLCLNLVAIGPWAETCRSPHGLICGMGQGFPCLLALSRNKDKNVQHLPDATIPMQLLFFPGFTLYWNVPNVSLPRNTTAQGRAKPSSESRSMLVFSP